ncbi:MAG: hypothetical protein LBQ20_09280 [Rhodanobacter sp.]|nr:hypothetical protein [Rhodanobacter sp.]
MSRLVHVGLAAVTLLLLVAQVGAQELLFTSAQESRRILSTRDEFVQRMSPFDRAARMKTSSDISESQFLEFVASAALDWKPREKDRIKAAFRAIQPEITRLSLPLPSQIYFIKTSGQEEGHAAYTRQNAIILPVKMLSLSDNETKRIIAHELFHISSRANPRLAKALYKTIGFQYCGEIEFPVSLAPRKITNPDAPKNDYYIQLKLGEQSILAVPILFSQTAQYDVSRGGEFFEYLQLAFLLVESPVGSNIPQVLNDSQKPRLVALQQVSGFFEQVGQNTEYVIHPEEILADNFAFLVLKQEKVRSPEILAKIRSSLVTFKGIKSAD